MGVRIRKPYLLKSKKKKCENTEPKKDKSEVKEDTKKESVVEESTEQSTSNTARKRHRTL